MQGAKAVDTQMCWHVVLTRIARAHTQHTHLRIYTHAFVYMHKACLWFSASIDYQASPDLPCLERHLKHRIDTNTHAHSTVFLAGSVPCVWRTPSPRQRAKKKGGTPPNMSRSEEELCKTEIILTFTTEGDAKVRQRFFYAGPW